MTDRIAVVKKLSHVIGMAKNLIPTTGEFLIDYAIIDTKHFPSIGDSIVIVDIRSRSSPLGHMTRIVSFGKRR